MQFSNLARREFLLKACTIIFSLKRACMSRIIVEWSGVNGHVFAIALNTTNMGKMIYIQHSARLSGGKQVHRLPPA